MNVEERAGFVSAYTKILTTTWSDEEFAARLETSPAETAREAGLLLPAGAEVVVLRDFDEPAPGEDRSIETQIALWEEGIASGRFELHVPRIPQVDTSELSEEELLGVAGGGGCCCCCPCCCFSINAA